MKSANILGAGLAAAIAGMALAQQPAPPAPAFAASNVTDKGVRMMAANCAMCHGFQGRPASGSGVASLAGRDAGRLVAAMKEFKEGKREATIMHQIAKGFTDAEVSAIAAYFEKQTP